MNVEFIQHVIINCQRDVILKTVLAIGCSSYMPPFFIYYIFTREIYF